MVDVCSAGMDREICRVPPSRAKNAEAGQSAPNVTLSGLPGFGIVIWKAEDFPPSEGFAVMTPLSEDGLTSAPFRNSLTLSPACQRAG